jgi:tmRNA-binding protein
MSSACFQHDQKQPQDLLICKSENEKMLQQTEQSGYHMKPISSTVE